MTTAIKKGLRSVGKKTMLWPALYTLALLWLVFFPSNWSVLALILVGLISYFRPIDNIGGTLWLFITVTMLAPRMIIRLATPSGIDGLLETELPISIIFLAIFFGLLYAIILRIKQRTILHRQQWHFFVYLLALYLMYLAIFFQTTTLWSFLGIYLILYLITNEYMLSNQEANENKKQIRLASLSISFLLLQAIWIIQLLPLSAIASATTMILLSFLLLELCFRYLSNELNAKRTRQYFAIFVLAILFIALSVQWQL